MERAVVIGSSAEALAAAALLAGQGVAVRCLGTGEPEVGLGAAAVRTAEDLAALARAWGDLREISAGRAVRWRGRLRELPETRASRAEWVLEVGGIAGLVGAMAARRGAAAADSYAARARARYGPRFAESVLLPWARKRFATAPGRLDAGLFDVLHGAPPRYYAPVGGAAGRAARHRDAILAAGGDVLEEVGVERIEIEDGRAAAVVTDVGREWVGGLLVTDASPRSLQRWIGEDAPPSPGESAHAVVVTVPVAALRLPWITWDASADRPFWRLSRPDVLPGGGGSANRIAVHLTLSDDDPRWLDDTTLLADVCASLDGIAEVLDGRPRIARLVDGVAIPTLDGSWSGWRARLRRMGVAAIGRRVHALPTGPQAVPADLP